jgi:hypothetical protein
MELRLRYLLTDSWTNILERATEELASCPKCSRSMKPVLELAKYLGCNLVVGSMLFT